MNVLLDTNVLSEVRRAAPDPKVMAWLDTLDEDHAFISVASIAELRRGVALMNGGRRDALAAWLAEDLPARLTGRIVPIDPAIAECWGDLMSQARQSGFALSVMDGFFAATAVARALTLATRNTKDFAALGVPLFDPWADDGRRRDRSTSYVQQAFVRLFWPAKPPGRGGCHLARVGSGGAVFKRFGQRCAATPLSERLASAHIFSGPDMTR